ncbi:hypothetical protein B5F07_15585 [Lachnoclostridium sp. An169]|uniref:DUF5702 domain-containing protein n=1 Tax=Lachnoclostridium sp. An169 TaxID=1965569 RepID=UPI000B373673|nr:DUF5702 domain-containing protein [Lachnoclostridium sp. An169]OUP82012.1 hypothetical protein B5F07_15585 [Lachnoclostridium sp. An169]HJA65671.1 hypothetical protein [Candidatus Mediterraneibacter cottocaccae]
MKIQEKKGEITAFLSIVFVLLVSFISGILQISSIHVSKNMSRLETDRAIFSIFGEYQRNLLEDYHVFALEGSYGSGEYKEDNILRRMHYYGSPGTEHEITGIQYLTDNNGQSFREQVLAYMEQRYGIGIIQNLTGLTGEWSRQEIETEEMEKELKEEGSSVLDEFNEIRGDSEELEEDPFTCLEEIEKSGLLSVVLPGEMSLSGRAVSLEKQVSYRSRTTGRGSFPMRQNMDGIEEKLMFDEYVLKYFKNAAMDSSGAAKEDDNRNTSLEYEVEYILEGKSSDKENLEAVLLKIFLIRMALNYAYLMTDTQKQGEAKALALTISVILLNPELSEAVSPLILLAWAAGESVVDIRTLLAGRKAPLVKSKENWQVSLFSLFTLGTGTEDLSGGDTEDGISYEDYLRGFLFLKNKDNVTMRTIDRVEENLSAVRGMDFFRADQCITRLELKNTVEIYGNITYEFPAYFGYE